MSLNKIICEMGSIACQFSYCQMSFTQFRHIHLVLLLSVLFPDSWFGGYNSIIRSTLSLNYRVMAIKACKPYDR